MPSTQHELSDEDRAFIVAAPARLGLRRAAKELGISEVSIASVAAHRERAGTRAILASTVPRLRRELAAHDSGGPRVA